MNGRARPGPVHRLARGFTLLEVLVAAAVLAVALGAVLRVVHEQTGEAAALRERTLAHWVALDRVHEVRLAAAWPAPGVERGERESAGHRWHWTSTVRTTPLPSLREVTVEVRADAGGKVLAHGSAWLARDR